MTKESESNLKLFLSNVPLVSRLFTVQNMIGEGTFSKVYKAKFNQSQVDFALKCVIPTIKPSRIIPELRYLRDMGGDSNIIEIKTCLFENGYTIIVMPYFQHDRFVDYVKDMSLEEIRDYMRNLLIALKKVHLNKVIHRDIKPNNFLYNRAERRFALVDFGLAQYEVDVLKASKAISRVHSTLLNGSKSKQQHKIKSHHESLAKKESHSQIAGQSLSGRGVQTANSLFKSKDKMVCVRKRLLTDHDDENTFPHRSKKPKHDHSPIKLLYRSSVFHTPSTPIDVFHQQLASGGKLMNMTNLQSTPTATGTVHNPLHASLPASTVTPLCFNAIPNFSFDAISKQVAPLTPENSSFNYPLNGGGAQTTANVVDQFKTPTKQRPANAAVLGQLQNSPNSLIIPETPPKSSTRLDRKPPAVRSFSKMLNSPTKSSCTATATANSRPATTITSSYHKSTTGHHKSSNISSLSSSLSSVNLNCKCFGLDQICKICAKRNECMAPRAGTPGFRAPEVLLKHLCQTSAIDIWSSGVIFASLLTKKYPFFRNTDDLTSLAEIISIFGSERVQKAAQAIGKQTTSSEKSVQPVNLKETLTRLRGDQMEIDGSAFDLLDKLLDPNPLTRINAADALNHPFLSNSNCTSSKTTS